MTPTHDPPDVVPHAGATTGAGGHEPFPLRRLDVIAIGAFWTLLAILTAVNGMLDPRGGRTPAWSWSVLGFAVATSAVWAGLTPAIFWVGARAAMNRSRWIPRLIVLLAVGILVAVFVEALTAYVRVEIFGGLRGTRGPAGAGGGGARDFNPLFGASRLFWLDDLIVFIAVLAAGFARDAGLRYRARQDESIRLQAQAAELNAQLADARLDALRRQLHPHFLFNTLHAVSSLVERDPRGVRRMISRLSDLLRYSIEGAETPEITLRKELELLGRYVDIMQVRFQGRLEFETRIDDRAMDALVPNLLLQPLVENAIKHGVEQLTGPGRIALDVTVNDTSMMLRVSDNGATFISTGAERGTEGEADAGASGGVGLRNTVQRLEQLYGDLASFTLGPGPLGGAMAEVRLPLHAVPMHRMGNGADSSPESAHVA